MIRGVHTMFYSAQADELRIFLRDKLGLPFTDVGAGWLIFDLPEAEMGAHPSDETHAHSRAGMPVAMMAFHRRAPSRCMRRPCCRAHWLIASSFLMG